MKNLLLAIGALLVISGIVSVDLWRDLRSERLENTHLTTQLAEANMTPRAPANSAQPIAAPGQTADVSGSPAAMATTALVQADSEAASKVTATAISAGAVAAAKGSDEAELMSYPEYREAQLTMTRLRTAQSNPGLAETLGLSEK